MKNITPDMVRDKCAELGIPHRQVWEACGLNISWFNKMIMDNERHSFKEPNPEWMLLIWEYLTLYEKEHQKFEQRMDKVWRK